MFVSRQTRSNGKYLLNPCLIRDHNTVLRQLIRKHEADPIDQNASAAIQDAEYAEGLERYGEEYQQITNKVWEKVYVQNTPLRVGEIEELIRPEAERKPNEIAS